MKKYTLKNTLLALLFFVGLNLAYSTVAQALDFSQDKALVLHYEHAGRIDDQAIQSCHSQLYSLFGIPHKRVGDVCLAATLVKQIEKLGRGQSVSESQAIDYCVWSGAGDYNDYWGANSLDVGDTRSLKEKQAQSYAVCKKLVPRLPDLRFAVIDF